MTLTELRNEVYALTNRPDLEGLTTSAIRSATLSLHQKEFFSKDLWETGISFATSEYLQELDYAALNPLWRSLKYIRKSDVGGANGPIFCIIQLEAVIDSFGTNQLDVAYLAGRMLKINSATPFQYAFLGAYLNPDITTAGFNSWIANEHPFAIVYTAAETVFKAIGRTEEFAAFRALRQERVSELFISNIQTVGY